MPINRTKEMNHRLTTTLEDTLDASEIRIIVSSSPEVEPET